jgi:hypothetical protein
VLSGLLALACSPVELAEAEVAVRDEGAHATRLGEGQGLPVVGLAPLGVKPVGMSRDVAKQVQRVSRESWLMGRGFDRAVSQAPRLVEPTEHEAGATQRVQNPTETAGADDSARRVTLEELLTFPKPVQPALRSPRRAAPTPRRNRQPCEEAG